MAPDASRVLGVHGLNQENGAAHGEDTKSVLIELLDYTWDDIATLQEERVIL